MTRGLSEVVGSSVKCLGSEVDCLWDTWVDWSVCQFSCGGGESVRTRKVKVIGHGERGSLDVENEVMTGGERVLFW